MHSVHSTATPVPPQELDNLVAEVMRHMLFMHGKDGAPVARSDLTGFVTKRYKARDPHPPPPTA